MDLQIHQQHESVAIDTATGLMWQRFSLGQSFENGRVTGDAQKFNFDESLKAASEYEHLGFKDWRVPTIKELLSIVDYDRFNPIIDTDVFLETVPYHYWSSSPVHSSNSYAWVVDFYSGNSNWNLKDGDFFARFFVRLVRNNV